MQQRLQGICGNFFVARPLPVADLVLDPRRDGKLEINEGGLDGCAVGFLRLGLRYFELRQGTRCFEIAVRVVNGQHPVCDKGFDHIAGVFAVQQFLRGNLQLRQLGGSSAGKLDMANANADSGDAVVDRVDRLRFGVLMNYVFNRARHRVFNQHGLQYVGNLAEQASVGGQFAFEKRNALFYFLQQVLIREPYEISKVYGNKFLRVRDFEFKFGAGSGVGVGIRDVAEGAGLPELPCGFFEIFFVSDGAHRQSAGQSNFFRGEAFAAGHCHRDQLVGRRRHGTHGYARGRLGLRRGGETRAPHCSAKKGPSNPR